MDAFSVACGFAGIDPGYFYSRMDLDEYEAIDRMYKESWEKARLSVLAMGGKFPLPWDNEQTEGNKFTKEQRLQAAANLNNILQKNHD